MNLTKYEKVLKIAGLLGGFVFLVTGFVVFIFFSETLFYIFNRVSSSLFPSLPLASDSGKFWLAMTLSMMAGVSTTSILIYIDVQRYYSMAIPLFIMKFVSSISGLGFFITGIVMPQTGWNTLANAVIFITDFPLGLLFLFLYLKVSGERKCVAESVR